jgi:hypothetical protein
MTRFGCTQADAAKHSLAPVTRHNPHHHSIMFSENKWGIYAQDSMLPGTVERGFQIGSVASRGTDSSLLLKATDR